MSSVVCSLTLIGQLQVVNTKLDAPIFHQTIWNFKISILVFLCFQPITPNLSKAISWRLGEPDYKHQYNDNYLSVIIIERGSSTLYHSCSQFSGCSACDDCWQWLPTGGNINQWALIDETLCCCCVLWLVNDFVINKVLCSLNIHWNFSSIQC